MPPYRRRHTLPLCRLSSCAVPGVLRARAHVDHPYACVLYRRHRRRRRRRRHRRRRMPPSRRLVLEQRASPAEASVDVKPSAVTSPRLARAKTHYQVYRLRVHLVQRTFAPLGRWVLATTPTPKCSARRTDQTRLASMAHDVAATSSPPPFPSSIHHFHSAHARSVNAQTRRVRLPVVFARFPRRRRPIPCQTPRVPPPSLDRLLARATPRAMSASPHASSRATSCLESHPQTIASSRRRLVLVSLKSASVPSRLFDPALDHHQTRALRPGRCAAVPHAHRRHVRPRYLA
mmetsp:Transcript_2653/g.9548  ORF Transcript_2653/g.9548 Transcript_2653/m.9548 type:complete len:290 (+) Transcript_2653:610-1479(+)